MPIAAIDDEFVRSEIMGQVEAVTELEGGWFRVCIGLAQADSEEAIRGSSSI